MEGHVATSIKILNAHTFDSAILLLRIHPTKSYICVKSLVNKVVTAALFLIIKFGNDRSLYIQMVYFIFRRFWKITVPYKSHLSLQDFQICYHRINHLNYNRVNHIINLVFYLTSSSFFILCMCIFSFFQKRLPDVWHFNQLFFPSEYKLFVCVYQIWFYSIFATIFFFKNYFLPPTLFFLY